MLLRTIASRITIMLSIISACITGGSSLAYAAVHTIPRGKNYGIYLNENSPPHIWVSSHGAVITYGPATGFNVSAKEKYQEYELHGTDKCLTYRPSNNTLYGLKCASKETQEWASSAIAKAVYTVTNKDDGPHRCLTGHKIGEDITMTKCSAGHHSQEWVWALPVA
jgi:hypothetical protein